MSPHDVVDGTAFGYPLTLNALQWAAVRRADERCAQAGRTFPTPASMRVDSVGTLHVMWLINGTRAWLYLSRSGGISSEIDTVARVSADVLMEAASFNIALQQLFVVDAALPSA